MKLLKTNQEDEDDEDPCISILFSADRFFIDKFISKFSETFSATDRVLKYLLLKLYLLKYIRLAYITEDVPAKGTEAPATSEPDGNDISVSFSCTSRSAFSHWGTFRSVSIPELLVPAPLILGHALPPTFMPINIGGIDISSLIGLPLRNSVCNIEIFSHLPYKSNTG